MGVLDWFGIRESTPTPEPGRLATVEYQLEEAQASLDAMASMMREDRGWQSLVQSTDRDMTREGLREVSRYSRVMAVASPLIKRGLGLRSAYVWGSGVGVSARADGAEDGEQDVNAVVQAFLDDDENRAALTGAQAHDQLETALGTDGNVFVALFTNPLNGFVQPRTLDTDEITEILTDPDDKTKAQFYKREYVRVRAGERTGRDMSSQETVYYPALGYRPRRRTPLINGSPVQWDAPVYHVRVNSALGGKWGLPDAYAALPWARAHKEFLEDWALLTKSLSKIAWRATSKRSAAQQMRSAFQSAEAGGIANMGPQDTLEAVPKTGATIDAESGRPLATMVASAFGIPVTALLADPGQTGARAVAETLSLPTRLEMMGRREVWTEAYRRILGYVIDQAVLAPRGPLKGVLSTDPLTGRETVQITGVDDRTLDITWPELDETPVETLVQAIVQADSTQKLPPLETLRLLLRALGVRDVDEIVKACTDENGDWVDPNVSAGQVAVDAYNRGMDPAEALRR